MAIRLARYDLVVSNTQHNLQNRHTSLSPSTTAQLLHIRIYVYIYRYIKSRKEINTQLMSSWFFLTRTLHQTGPNTPSAVAASLLLSHEASSYIFCTFFFPPNCVLSPSVAPASSSEKIWLTGLEADSSAWDSPSFSFTICQGYVLIHSRSLLAMASSCLPLNSQLFFKHISLCVNAGAVMKCIFNQVTFIWSV